MEIKRAGEGQIIFLHDGVASARPMMWIGVGCIAVAAVATFFGGSWLSLIVVLVVGALILSMLRNASARTAAVFDRAHGTVEITHTRGGAIVGEEDVALADIADVIVEPATGGIGMTAGQHLSLRPSLFVGDRLVPLTYHAFESGPRPIEAAAEIRAFLGRARDNLVEDSVTILAQHSDRVQPALRLARLGLGLDRLEAAEMVARLREGE